MKDGTPVTEIVYIHSKVNIPRGYTIYGINLFQCLIIDDRIALIGSANINDRSMLGSRDSELAVVVEDTTHLQTTMAGEPYRVNKFAHELRKKCFKSIFGFDELEEVNHLQN